jgi:hypothetical protein
MPPGGGSGGAPGGVEDFGLAHSVRVSLRQVSALSMSLQIRRVQARISSQRPLASGSHAPHVHPPSARAMPTMKTKAKTPSASENTRRIFSSSFCLDHLVVIAHRRERLAAIWIGGAGCRYRVRASDSDNCEDLNISAPDN